METKHFYIIFNVDNGEEIKVPILARKDICDVIDQGLIDKEKTPQDLVEDIIKLQALLLGIDPKKGSVYFEGKDNLN